MQGVQDCCPYLFWKVPRGHSLHTEDLVAAAKLPGKHTLHCAEPAHHSTRQEPKQALCLVLRLEAAFMEEAQGGFAALLANDLSMCM